MRPQPRPAPAPQQRFAATAQMPPGHNNFGMGPSHSATTPAGYGPAHTGEVAFAETISPHAGLMALPEDSFNDPRRAMSQAPEYARGPHPTGGSGDYHGPRSGGPNRMQPTMPASRFGGPPGQDSMRGGGPGQGTMTAQRFKRRPPAWVVAALSCSIALLIAGVAIAILSTTGTPAPTRPTPSGATAALGPASGPFSTARQGFNSVASSGPGSSLTPPSGASTVPPVVTAAAPVETAPPAGIAAAPPEPTTAPSPPAAPATPAATTAAPTPPAPVQTAARPTPAPQPQPQPAGTPKPAGPAALGALTVVCIPKCDQIVDNGSPLGPGHNFNRPVSSGRHVLSLSAPNGVKKTMQVEVAPGETREVRISMDR
jgi:outer membrane biosynthesis protein TonB